MDAPKSEIIGRYFFGKLQKWVAASHLPSEARVRWLGTLLHQFFQTITEDSGLHFYTLFSRVAFAFQLIPVNDAVERAVHQFRRKYDRWLHSPTIQWRERELLIGARALSEAVAQMTGLTVPETLCSALPSLPSLPRELPEQQQLDQLRVVLLDHGSQDSLLAEDETGRRYTLKPHHKTEDYFAQTVRLISRDFGFPVVATLLNVQVIRRDEAIVWLIVLEPDWLIDVTAIANCFQTSGAIPELYLLQRFLPWSASPHLLLGHAVNYLFDQLFAQTNLTWSRPLLRELFKLNPFAFAKMDDRAVRQLLQKLRGHFATLKAVLCQLPKAPHHIDLANVHIEPTFYSSKYGLQGRLDLLHRASDGTSSLVELKSGKIFNANAYGINSNHYVQTLLYDLLMESAFGGQTQRRNYLLYSQTNDTPLRYAPPVRAIQHEAIQLRNELVALDRRLSKPLPHQYPRHFEQLWHILLRLHSEHLPQVKGFHRSDLMRFAQTMRQLDPLEQRWFAAFITFIAREHRFAKVGSDNVDAARGRQATLWLDPIGLKKQRFEILNDLVLVENRAGEADPVLSLAYTNDTVKLSNFRKGDIAVLYPKTDGSPLNNQLFKCTIVTLEPQSVQVRLRARQVSSSLFAKFERWHLEPDVLDSAFYNLYRSLFAFAQAPKDKRALWLGIRQPQQSKSLSHTEIVPQGLTSEQQRVFRKGLEAGECFLLWGPPGTGKTSQMLRAWVQWLLRFTDEHILLLAYTNRAVDEICHALEAIDAAWLPAGSSIHDYYLRVGGRHATHPRFRGQLLSEQVKQIDCRAELITLLNQRRIVVGTVSTLSNRPELFELKKFHRVIVDEASQLTEPMIAGLLAQFPKVMLIGDHRQLPAVVAQPDRYTKVHDERLQQIGLKDLGNSLFERLYMRFREKGWTYAFDHLNQQGRMHVELMTFANEEFYEHMLQPLPNSIQAAQHLYQPLNRPLPTPTTELACILARHRMVYIPTQPEEIDMLKQNTYEAQQVVEVIRTFMHMYAQSEVLPTIGVIVPYRAQIACIRQELERHGIDPNQWTIDTVERYQGGARDVVILSLVTNSVDQLSTIVKLNDEGVDRKLNVAMTRAREQVVIIGTREVLESQPLYRRLLARCHAANLAVRTLD